MLKKSLLLFAFAVFLSAAANLTTYTYKTVDGLNIDLDVYTPSGAAPKGGYPVIICIHGGSYYAGSKSGAITGQERAEILNRGWVAVAINYRLLPGVVLQEVFEDVQDAYSWVRTELAKKISINLDLITIFGRSAGGGLAVMSGYKLSPRPACIIGFYSGLTNFTEPLLYNPNTPVDPSLVASVKKLSVPVVTEYTATKTDAKTLLLYTAAAQGKAGWMMVTHDPDFPTDQVKSILKEYSATENIDRDYPPTYLAHGTSDTTVPYSQSVQLASSLEAKEIPYVLDLVANAGHSFDNNASYWEEHVLPAFDFAQVYMKSSAAKKARHLRFPQPF